MNIIDKYIFKVLLKNIIVTALTLVLILGLFKVLDENSNINGLNYTFGSALIFTLFQIPYFLAQIGNITVLIASILTVSYLNLNKELLIIQTGYISLKSLLKKIVKYGFILAAFIFVLTELLYPKMLSIGNEYKNHQLHGQNTLGKESNIWLKDANKIFFFREKVSQDNFFGIFVFETSNQGLSKVLSSETAVIDNNTINLQNPLISKINEKERLIKVDNTSLQNIELNSDLFSKEFWKISQDLNYVYFHDLIKRIFTFKSNMNTNALSSELYGRILKIFSIIPMLLISLPLAFDYSRSREIHTKVFFGIMVGISFHLFSKMTNVISAKLDSPPFLNLLVPMVIFLIIAYVFLKNKLEND